MKTRLAIPREKESRKLSRHATAAVTNSRASAGSSPDAIQRLIDNSSRVRSMQVYQAMADAAQLKKDTFYPDANRYPHIHYHSGGVTFSWSGSRHNKLKTGESWNTATIQRVIDELRASPYMDAARRDLLVARLERHKGGSD